MKFPTSRDQELKKIFISYRHSDVPGHARRLQADLKRHFGEDVVFIDIYGLEGGDPYKTIIKNALASCKVFIVVIGPGWVTVSDKNNVRRLDKEDDLVRLEIESALERPISVIPVLMLDARLPLSEELPKSLIPLRERQAKKIDDVDWDDDVNDLIEIIEKSVTPHRPWVLRSIVATVVLAIVLLLWIILKPTGTGNANIVTAVTPTPIPQGTQQPKVNTAVTPTITSTPTPTPSPSPTIPSTTSPIPTVAFKFWTYKRPGVTYIIEFKSKEEGFFRYRYPEKDFIRNRFGEPVEGTWSQNEREIELTWTPRDKDKYMHKDKGTITTDGKRMIGKGGDGISSPYDWEATRID